MSKKNKTNNYSILQIPGENANWNAFIPSDKSDSNIDDSRLYAWPHISHSNHVSAPHVSFHTSTPHGNATTAHASSNPHASATTPHANTIITPHVDESTSHVDEHPHNNQTPHTDKNQHVNT
jgi:hypothetical protein